MLYLDRVPAPPLDRFISSIWFCRNDPRPFGLERVLPSGAAQIIVNLKEDRSRAYCPESGAVSAAGGTLLTGISTHYEIIDTAEQECVAGVCFRPGGTAAFFGIPADEFGATGIPLECAWNRARSFLLREQLLAARTPHAALDVLEQTMGDAWTESFLDPAVGYALGIFAGPAGVGVIPEVAGRVGLSQRRMAERFRTTVGLAPKRYCRIVRFQRALACAERGRRTDWTRVAQDCGYFDQAHFIHDFRAFSGITPTGYDADRTQFRNHVHFLQADSAAGVR